MMFVQARPFPQALQACSLKAAKPFSSIIVHEPPCSWRNTQAQMDQSTSDEAKEPDCILLDVASTPGCGKQCCL